MLESQRAQQKPARGAASRLLPSVFLIRIFFQVVTKKKGGKVTFCKKAKADDWHGMKRAAESGSGADDYGEGARAGGSPPLIPGLGRLPPGLDANMLLNPLRTYFGFTGLRTLQAEAIGACLRGRDVFVRATTGSGKSLCYQLPPLVLNKPAVVISPLISLMSDQVTALAQANVSACALSSMCTDANVWRRAREGGYSLVYMSPERFERWQDGLRAMQRSRGICLFAVDEAHCISEWGHDFRSSYRALGRIRQEFPGIPIMALTATATQRVQNDVLRNLRMSSPRLARTGLDRPNLTFEVRPKRSIALDLTRELFSAISGDGGGSSIVYCLSKRHTREIAAHLSRNGVRALAYNGDLNAEQRRHVHEAFSFDRIDVVVATLAFGMGIDKPDIRMVVHYGMPKTLEAYFQQTGRAGRDGAPARCVLFWSNADLGMSNFYTKNMTKAETKAEFLRMSGAMERYAKAAECRRRLLLGYFGERYLHDNCGGCDNCASQADARDLTDEARSFAHALDDIRNKFGMTVLVGVLKGSDTAQLRGKQHMFRRPLRELKSYGSLKHLKIDLLKGMVTLFESHSILESHFVGNGIRVYRVGPSGRRLISQPKLRLPKMRIPEYLKPLFDRNRRAVAAAAAASLPHAPGNDLIGDEKKLFLRLLGVRSAVAMQANVPPYMVLARGSLDEMARLRPADEEHLAMVSGVASRKRDQYGTHFLAEIRRFCAMHGLETNVEADSAAGPAGGQGAAWTRKIGTTAASSGGGCAVAPRATRRLSASAARILKLFQSGKGVSELARHLRVPKKRILAHMATAIRLGCDVDWSRLGLPGAATREVEAAFTARGGPGADLRIIKSDVDADISYEHIQLVQARLQIANGPPPPPSPPKPIQLPPSPPRVPSRPPPRPIAFTAGTVRKGNPLLREASKRAKISMSRAWRMPLSQRAAATERDSKISAVENKPLPAALPATLPPSSSLTESPELDVRPPMQCSSKPEQEPSPVETQPPSVSLVDEQEAVPEAPPNPPGPPVLETAPDSEVAVRGTQRVTASDNMTDDSSLFSDSDV